MPGTRPGMTKKKYDSATNEWHQGCPRPVRQRLSHTRSCEPVLVRQSPDGACDCRPCAAADHFCAALAAGRRTCVPLRAPTIENRLAADPQAPGCGELSVAHRGRVLRPAAILRLPAAY